MCHSVSASAVSVPSLQNRNLFRDLRPLIMSSYSPLGLAAYQAVRVPIHTLGPGQDRPIYLSCPLNPPSMQDLFLISNNSFSLSFLKTSVSTYNSHFLLGFRFVKQKPGIVLQKAIFAAFHSATNSLQ